MVLGKSILAKPPRGGRKFNLANLIKKRIAEFEAGNTQPVEEQSKPIPHRKLGCERALATAVSSKIELGNLKAAIRLLCSDEKPAQFSDETFIKLQAKHPQAPADRRIYLPPVQSSLLIETGDVSNAILTFPNGSAGGSDGVRPQHLKDLINCAETKEPLLLALANFINLLLEGTCPNTVQPFLFGGNLIALQKKDGGVRPIAVGTVWRRLAAKCANFFALNKLQALFHPRQVGVGVKGGAEAAVHATRRYIQLAEDDHIVVKLDFSNAFNCLRRDCMLEAVYREIPEIYNFCHLSYASSSYLSFGDQIILSEEGSQQGDPLGPLLFSLTVNPILSSILSDLALGYLDDFTLGGTADVVRNDFLQIVDMAADLGLILNTAKCELISNSTVATPDCFAEFVHLTPSDAILLGAPLFPGTAMDDALGQRCEELARTLSRLDLITAHDALLMLKASAGFQKLVHILRSSPCFDHPALREFDDLLRAGISKITNNDLDDFAWLQATLPVSDGGLGIRSVCSLAPSAFLASAAATLELQTAILPEGFSSSDSAVDMNLSVWKDRTDQSPLEGSRAYSQTQWDRSSVEKSLAVIRDHYTDPYHTARILAVQSPHSGDWLHAWPITACGLRLDNEAIRIAVGLRLGSRLCEPHTCPCGTCVDARGNHGLACRRSMGRHSRHSALNDIVHRGLLRAKIPSVKEPVGLSRDDGKRPDGATLIPWRNGKCLTWDVTAPDTLAKSYLQQTALVAGAACKQAAERKISKYIALSRTHEFCPIAIETLGPINDEGMSFLQQLGHHMTSASGDKREFSFLMQRISIAVQRSNAVAILGTMTNDDDV